MSTVSYYLKLLDSSYQEAVEKLQYKYGISLYNYFNELSFKNRRAEGFIKRPKSQFGRSRSKEGLMLHHIDENKISNLSNLNTLKKYGDYIYQQRDHLVYCNLLEHLILHALIAKETKNKLGIGGYRSIPQQLVNLYNSKSKKKNDIKYNEAHKKAINLDLDDVKKIIDKSKKMLD